MCTLSYHKQKPGLSPRDYAQFYIKEPPIVFKKGP